jgi:hypothetical protein
VVAVSPRGSMLPGGNFTNGLTNNGGRLDA